MEKDDIINYVMETPGNSNPAVLGSMLDSYGGGGSGSGGTIPERVIHLIQNQDNNTFTADITFQELSNGIIEETETEEEYISRHVVPDLIVEETYTGYGETEIDTYRAVTMNISQNANSTGKRCVLLVKEPYYNFGKAENNYTFSMSFRGFAVTEDDEWYTLTAGGYAPLNSSNSMLIGLQQLSGS